MSLFLAQPKQVVFSLFFLAKYVWGSIFTLSFLEPNLQPICHDHVGSIILMIENVHLIKRVENISRNKIYIYLIVIYACSKHIFLLRELVCFLYWSCICRHSINITFCISIIFGVLYNANISDHQNDGAYMLDTWQCPSRFLLFGRNVRSIHALSLAETSRTIRAQSSGIGKTPSSNLISRLQVWVFFGN